MFLTHLLAAVRVSVGLTQEALAARSGISQTEISHIEAGRRTLGPDRIEALATALGVPAELLSADAPAPRILHRLQSSLPARAVSRLSAELTLAGVRLQRLVPTSGSAELVKSTPGESPEDAARSLREAWHVHGGPIPDLTALLEAHGVPCIIRDLDNVKVHAIGSWDKGRPFVVVNASATPRQRRLAVAHELGHAVMHSTPSAAAEGEADSFASAFLMPRSDMDGQLRDLTWSRVGALEERWGVPAPAIAKYARDVGVITATHYRKLRAQLLDLGSDATAAAPERPSLVATSAHAEPSLEHAAAAAMLSVSDLRRDYLAGAERRAR